MSNLIPRSVIKDDTTYYLLVSIRELGGPYLHPSNFMAVEGHDPLEDYRCVKPHGLTLEGLIQAHELNKGTKASNIILAEMLKILTPSHPDEPQQSLLTSPPPEKEEERLERLERLRHSTNEAINEFSQAAQNLGSLVKPPPLTPDLSRRLEEMSKQSSAMIVLDQPHDELTINWRSLLGEYEGVVGVSLRHLVSLGLYGKYQDAVAALNRMGGSVATVNSSYLSEHGRPCADKILTSLGDVQVFCAGAQTETGRKILKLVLDHHNELQELMSSSTPPQAPSSTLIPQSTVDVLQHMVDVLRETQQAQEQLAQARDEHHARLNSLERQLDFTIPAGQVTAATLAAQVNVRSAAGLPHAQALIALGLQLKLDRQGELISHVIPLDGQLIPCWYFTPEGGARMRRELASLIQAGDVDDDGVITFKIKTMSKTYKCYH